MSKLQLAEAQAVETEDFDQADQLNLQYSKLQDKLTALYKEQDEAESALQAAVKLFAYPISLSPSFISQPVPHK